MSLITKDHLSLILRTIKTLLTFKADKTELASKIDRSEIEDDDALEIVTDLGLVIPLAAVDGTIYTSPEGDIYTLD